MISAGVNRRTWVFPSASVSCRKITLLGLSDEPLCAGHARELALSATTWIARLLPNQVEMVWTREVVSNFGLICWRGVFGTLMQVPQQVRGRRTLKATHEHIIHLHRQRLTHNHSASSSIPCDVFWPTRLPCRFYANHGAHRNLVWI